MVVDDRRQPLEHGHVPVAPAVVAAADQLDRRVGALHDERERPRLLDVVLGVEAADLPAAVHLVAEAPVAHPVRRGVAVLTPQIRPVRVARTVAVLHPRLRLVRRAGAHVHADVGLGPQRAAVADELVGAEAVGFLRVPGELGPAWPVVHRPHTVEPVVAAHEVPAGPAEDGDAERADRVEHVAAKAGGVAQWRAFVEDPAVDAAAEVLDEVAEDAAIDGADAPRQIDADARHGIPPALLYSRSAREEIA